MDNISSVLKNKYQNKSDIGSKINKEIFFGKIIEIIKNILGEDIIKYIKPIYIKNNNLKIICHNPSIASIVRLKEPIILGEINKISNEFKINKIIIEIDSDF